MIKVIQVADDGTETAAIEVDDFTIEIVYAGLAELLRAAATETAGAVIPSYDLPRQARQRREKILSRVRS